MLKDTPHTAPTEETHDSIPETAQEQEVEREGFSPARALRNPRTLISFALALAIILFVFRGLNIDVSQTWSHIL
ncbi:MAG TPA: hypothetical protein VFT99_13940, partial [Roseiflexaceae bacterium]|nr:hypothetical protein [Roseiflexaceae bacterium]